MSTLRTKQQEEFSLTKKEERSLRAQIADIEDTKRFVVESRIGKTLRFYYTVENDTYVVNDLTEATLFKRRKAAEAIVEFLTKRDRIKRNKRISREGRFRVVPVIRRFGKYSVQVIKKRRK